MTEGYLKCFNFLIQNRKKTQIFTFLRFAVNTTGILEQQIIVRFAFGRGFKLSSKLLSSDV